MTTSVQEISAAGLLWGAVPAVVVAVIVAHWALDTRSVLIALARMLVQLIAIGFVLTFIFETEYVWLITLVLIVMLLAASWISLRPLQTRSLITYLQAFVATSVAGIPVLLLVSQLVLELEPWFTPRYVVPLAGMIFAASMNAVSLAAERFEVEASRGQDHVSARNSAFNASLIPTVNTLLAVGLVSLPGMMTGQILAGVDPLVAVKYQIVIMTTLFGASGVSAALYLRLQKSHPKP